MKINYLISLFIFTLLSCDNAKTSKSKKDPNIIFIISDDQSWGDYSFMGHPHIQTPNIDQLAAEGVIFSNAHSNAPICGPSRSSFMTGIYPHNSNNYGFENWYNHF